MITSVANLDNESKNFCTLHKGCLYTIEFARRCATRLSRKQLLLLLLFPFATADTASAWDPLNDLLHPDQTIRRNLPVPLPQVPTPSIPGPSPDVINGCLNDLRSCPQRVWENAPESEVIEACVQNIAKCPEEIVKRVPAQAAWPIINAYRSNLNAQAQGRWRSLPPWFMSEFNQSYSVNLESVRYAQGINTIHGDTITFADRIYSPHNIDLDTYSGKQLMLHELQHTVQYQQKGGLDAFISEYILHAAGKVIQKKSIDIHDEIGTENDAIRKAKDLIEPYGWEFRVENGCSRPIKFTLRYWNSDGDWITDGDWNIESGESHYLYDENSLPLHTKSGRFYYYAEIVGTRYTWSGDHNVSHNGQQLKFVEKTYDEFVESLDVVLTCNNIN